MDHIALDLDLEDPATAARLAGGGELLVTLIVRDRRNGVRRQAIARITARVGPRLGIVLALTIPRLGSQVVAERIIVPWKEVPDLRGDS